MTEQILLKSKSYYDGWYEENVITAEDIFKQFLFDKHNEIRRIQWSLIPANQYKNALKMFMSEGIFCYFPIRILENWLNIICKNITIIDIFNILVNFGMGFPFEVFNKYFNENVRYFYMAEIIFKREGFWDWARLPDGSRAISDYGLLPIYKVLRELPRFPSSEEMIIAINRCLDYAHARGDLASAFIEGGVKTCWEISNG